MYTTPKPGRVKRRVEVGLSTEQVGVLVTYRRLGTRLGTPTDRRGESNLHGGDLLGSGEIPTRLPDGCVGTSGIRRKVVSDLM